MNSTTKKKNLMQSQASYVSVKQRIVGFFTATILLLQICLPTVASAARLLTNESVTSAMASPSFQRSNSNAYLYQQASFDDAAYIGSQNITTFREHLVAAKSNLGKPTFIPIASDITIFVPTYPTGKLLGDVYVQNRYIRQQVFELLGRHLIYANSKETSETQQINALYENAYDYARKNPSINFGDNLDAGALSHDINFKDMVWPEIRTIHNERVVVPVLYLTDVTVRDNKVTSTRTEFPGDVVKIGSLSLDSEELTLGASTITDIAGNLTADKGSLINSHGDINLVVGGTLNLIGSSITGKKSVTIFANEANIKSLLVPFQDRYGSGTKLGRISGIDAGENISLTTTGNVTFEGSTATASNGSLTIKAGGNISILPLFATYQGQSTEGHWAVNSSSLDVIGSRLSAQDKISLAADGVINITASDLISTLGGIELLADQGIFIDDGTESDQKIAVDKKGKTTGQSSEFRTHAVRALLQAGKNIRLESEFGNIKLKAVDITSADGTSVIAKNGAVQLLTTTELEKRHLQTVSKKTWTIKTSTEYAEHETKLQNVIVGGLQVEATGGVQVEYVGDPTKQTLKGQLDTFAQMPGLSWMAEIYNSCLVTNKTEGDISGVIESNLIDLVDPYSVVNAQGNNLCDGKKINWAELEEVHKEVRKTKRNLSPAAMALVAIAITIATSGAGAGALAGGTTQVSLGTAAQAAMGAAWTAIDIQVVSSLLAGNSLGTTIRSLDDDEFVNSLATSMVTAGAMHAMPSFSLFPVDNATGWTQSALEFGNQAANAAARSAIQSGVSVYIQGGNSKDYLRAFNSALTTDALNTIGTKLHGKIANANWDTALNYISHAALGCAAGALTNKLQDTDIENGCVSGAGGAVITEAITANFMDRNVKEFANKVKNEGAIWPELEDKLTEFRKLGIDISRLAAAFTAFALKGDVNAAASSAEKVARANVYKAVDMIEIYKQVNGDVSTDPLRKERIKEKYRDRVRAALKEAGTDPATIDSLIAKMNSNNVFESAAKFEDERIGDGRNIEATVNARAKDSFDLPQEQGDGTANPDVITEVKTIGAPFSQIVGLSLDFLGATNRTINILTPSEREAVGIAFNVMTGGPLKTGLGYALSIGMDKVLPDEFANQIANAPVYLGTAGIGFLISSNYENTKDHYDHPANHPDLVYEVNEWVDGLTWLASNVIGLPGAKGTNTSSSIYVNGNQHGNNVHHEFGRTHHFWPSLDALYNDLKSAPVRISVMGKFSSYKAGDFVKYNDGKLGEAVMLDVLEGTTGKKFTSMQNLSGHGPDGVYIDPVTKTIYLAEAKSSVNGADKAAPPVGSPTARMNKWMNDYRAGKYNNADPATLNKFRELQQIYESSGSTPSIKGVWVQVEVPKFNSSNFTGVETIVSAWN